MWASCSIRISYGCTSAANIQNVMFITHLEVSSSKARFELGPSLPLLNLLCSFLKPDNKPAASVTQAKQSLFTSKGHFVELSPSTRQQKASRLIGVNASF